MPGLGAVAVGAALCRDGARSGPKPSRTMYLKDRMYRFCGRCAPDRDTRPLLHRIMTAADHPSGIKKPRQGGVLHATGISPCRRQPIW
ncbi:protein of unknown function [Pseudomonas sp. JV551A1]|nr:protein of unknown function [Pseudomonas sp. JV551A1]